MCATPSTGDCLRAHADARRGSGARLRGRGAWHLRRALRGIVGLDFLSAVKLNMLANAACKDGLRYQGLATSAAIGTMGRARKLFGKGSLLRMNAS